MTSREIVERTLDYARPERVARSFGDSDFSGTRCSVESHATDWKEIGGGRWERKDEWGNTWERIDLDIVTLLYGWISQGRRSRTVVGASMTLSFKWTGPTSASIRTPMFLSPSSRLSPITLPSKARSRT